MTRRRRSPWLVDAVRGGIAGAAGTWVMDLVTTGLLNAQSADVNARERAARPNDKGSVENLIDRLQSLSGVELSGPRRELAAKGIHYGLGVVPGAMYGVLRDRVPLVGAGRGLLYGLVLFLVNDEYVNTRLGLAGSYGDYPIETHWRGLVGHLALGVTTDTTIEVMRG